MTTPFVIKIEEVKAIMRSLPKDDNIEVFYHQVTGSIAPRFLEWGLDKYYRSSSFYDVY